MTGPKREKCGATRGELTCTRDVHGTDSHHADVRDTDEVYTWPAKPPAEPLKDVRRQLAALQRINARQAARLLELTAERDAALETVRELSSKVDTTAFERWAGDYMNQQRADRAEARITTLEAALQRIANLAQRLTTALVADLARAALEKGRT